MAFKDFRLAESACFKDEPEENDMTTCMADLSKFYTEVEKIYTETEKKEYL